MIMLRIVRINVLINYFVIQRCKEKVIYIVQNCSVVDFVFYLFETLYFI